MDVNKHVSLLMTHPSFDLGFDKAVNGANYLFGESVSLINFITLYSFCFPSVFWLEKVNETSLLPLLNLVPLCLTLKVTVKFETEGSGQNEIFIYMDKSEVKP